MSEVERIADQLKRASEGAAWHGPDLAWLLEDLTAEQVAARPIAGAHSIWELALHIAAWEEIARRRLGGDQAQDIADEENWPVVRDASEAAWRETLAKLEATNKNLREAVLAFGDARLDEAVVEGGSSAYVTVHGAVQHTLYHAGQIALLKKALGLEAARKET